MMFSDGKFRDNWNHSKFMFLPRCEMSKINWFATNFKSHEIQNCFPFLRINLTMFCGIFWRRDRNRSDRSFLLSEGILGRQLFQPFPFWESRLNIHIHPYLSLQWNSNFLGETPYSVLAGPPQVGPCGPRTVGHLHVYTEVGHRSQDPHPRKCPLVSLRNEEIPLQWWNPLNPVW